MNNARNFIAVVASCSYPLCFLLPPTLKSGGACAPPEYRPMAPAPMGQNVSPPLYPREHQSGGMDVGVTLCSSSKTVLLEENFLKGSVAAVRR